MGIALTAPRGGLVETLDGAPRVMILRNREIERFEDAHGSIFTFWDGLFGRAPMPKFTQIRDLLALGLVGGGLSDIEADAALAKHGPEMALMFRSMAQGLIGVAFLPDADRAASAPADGDGEDGGGKKTDPAGGMSAG